MELDNLNQTSKNRTVFHYACHNGYLDVAKLLMKNSIDLNIDLEAKDNDGYTALNYACYNNHPKIVEMIKRYSKLPDYLK